VQRRLASARLDVDVAGLVLDQHVHHVQVGEVGGGVDTGQAVVVLRVEVCALLQQVLERVQLVAPGRVEQWRRAGRVSST
jgi:hypothetical protein